MEYDDRMRAKQFERSNKQNGRKGRSKTCQEEYNMKKIIAKRQTGKTSKLIRLANGSGGIILVQDLNAVKYTIELAKKMNCNNVAVSTYEDFNG